MNPRSIAAIILNRVIRDRTSLSTALPAVLAQHRTVKQESLIKELCFGVLRWYFRLDYLAQQLLNKPIKDKDFSVYTLLLTGLYQIIFLRIADHAAVTETVNAARDLKKPWATGLINGVLRQFLREKTSLLNSVANENSAQFAHPQWLINSLQKAWPNTWSAILEVNNQHPPLCLRVNQQKISRQHYLQRLNSEGIEAEVVPQTKQGIILTQALPVEKILGFHEGLISVQDSAAQLAAELLTLTSQQRVLDACAAPGGKTAHMLEQHPDLLVTALDHDKLRLARVAENLTRLQLTANLIHADATDINAWWDEVPFDRILIDAPCSGTGVIRRHPDIKLLRQPTDIQQLKQQQSSLLHSLWPLLKAGGLLVYCTCSIMQDENISVLQNFLQQHTDAKEKIIHAEWGEAMSVGRQILPTEKGMDGFYYACLEKI
jgi:16S rRNA (cytosine967-C5)-methyltransferase